MSSILDQIVDRKRVEVADALSRVPLSILEERVSVASPARDFFGALRADRSMERTRVIAEIKRKSPSAGVIWTQPGPFDPVSVAQSYHAAGATAISCLTDEVGFGGDLGFIEPIREAVPLPVLRKDFMIDPYQVWEAREAGADAILLIAELLSNEQLDELAGLADELGLTTLIEVHDQDNLLRIRNRLHGRRLLGVNNRNLRTMTTDLAHVEAMRELLAEHLDILVCESGIRTRDDIERLRRIDIKRFLIGETLLRADDPGLALEDLLATTE